MAVWIWLSIQRRHIPALLNERGAGYARNSQAEQGSGYNTSHL